MHPSPCGRFLVLDALHVDRDAMAPLVAWSERHGLAVQDTVQLAIVLFAETVIDADGERPTGMAPATAWVAAASPSLR